MLDQNGDQVVAQLLNKDLNGEHIAVNEKGDVLKGNFRKGLISGEAEIWHLDGKYSGEVDKSLFNGKGKIISRGGKKLVGIFCKGSLIKSFEE